RSPLLRLKGLIALAAVGLDANPPDTTDLTAALDLAAGELKGRVSSPWLLLRLARLSVQGGLADRARQLADDISDVGLRGQVQLAALRAHLTDSNEKVDEALANALPEKTGARAA